MLSTQQQGGRDRGIRREGEVGKDVVREGGRE